MKPWVAICRLEDIPVLGARRVERERGMPVALFRTADDKVFALLDRCPHKGGPLSQGIVAGDGVACPLHGWVIGFADGAARAPDEGRTPTFDCRVDEGVVMLDREQLNRHALEQVPPQAGPCLRAGAVAAVAVHARPPGTVPAPAGA
ncbi:MAG: nitrite reductase small subunit NirD [Rubrivivax sp.]|nr:nitrite reductase small subunit NirD [Rubrivivax sp.]